MKSGPTAQVATQNESKISQARSNKQARAPHDRVLLLLGDVNIY